ncbi:hypothetical protein [Bdellovibrio sp. HCB-162]|uniref:hypothetical protein n=1 Tax=Bdellovibrio sp. HCB-162 TaxID=3394234 RepID=UPI0039BCB262
MNPMLPMNEPVLEAGLTLYTKVSTIMFGLVALAFTMRVVFLMVRIARPSEYGAVITDTIVYLGLSGLYPMLMKTTMSVCRELAFKVKYPPLTDVQEKIADFSNTLLAGYDSIQIFSKIFDITINLLSQSVYTIFLSLLLAIAPVMIFLSVMLGLAQGVKMYFGTFISFALWPVLWNLIGLLGKELGPHIFNSPLSVVVFWLVIQALQFLSPLFCFFLFRTASPSDALGKLASYASSIG